METELVDDIVRGLAERSWAVAPGFVDPALGEMLRAEALAMHEGGAFRAAGIGRGGELRIDAGVRSDSIRWLDEANLTSAQTQVWGTLEGLRLKLNRELFLGLKDLEAHLTVYPAGGIYQKHLDRFRAPPAGAATRALRREVSVVLYLNDAWKPGDGGELLIYDRDDSDRQVAAVAPVAGTLVCFLSGEVWHEVRPMVRPRVSLTGWFRA